MSVPNHGAVSDDLAAEEAATWFAKMRGPNALEHRPAFEAWMAAATLHRSAYNRAAEIFALGKLLRDDAAPENEIVPTRRKRTGLIVASVLTAVLVGTTLIAPQSRYFNRGEQAVNWTDIRPGAVLITADRTRSFRLADGSRVELAAGSALDTNIGPTTRRANLRSGAARFTIAAGQTEFVVTAGGGRLSANSTRFDVAISRASRVTIRLLRGLAALSKPMPSSGDAILLRLTEGQTASFATSPTRSKFNQADVGKQSNGGMQLPSTREFVDVPVGRLIAEVNESADRPIRLSSPQIATMRVSGRFRTDDTARLASRLADLFDLRIDGRDPSEIVLHQSLHPRPPKRSSEQPSRDGSP